MAEWTADEAYVMESSGVFCSISGRQYTKVNEGKALVSSFYINSGYTCPLIVSTEQDAVVYSALGKSFSYKTTVEYLGVTWYASNDEYAMGGNCSVSGYAQKLDGGYASINDAALALLQVANVQVLPDVNKKYLVESSGKLYTVKNGELVELEESALTADLFLNSGSDDIDGSLLLFLTNPKILYWTDDEEPPQIKATVTATPYPQNVTSKRIDLSHESITGIENMIAECEGELICAVSFDDKQTWKAWNGEVWATLTEDFTGMSKETLESITFEQWNELYSGADILYIRISLVDTTQSVTEIVVDFSN